MPRLVEILRVGPGAMGRPGLFVGQHAQVPDTGGFHLRGFEAREEGR